MALVLKVAAAALALIGAVTLYWGTNPALLSLGNTVMIVGAVIAAAGIILFGLAAVLGQLAILAVKLDALRIGLPVGTAVNDAIAAPVVPAPSAGQPETAIPAPPSAPAPAEAPAPPGSPVALDRLEEALMAPPPPPPAAPVVATPPSRQSFGLPPLAAKAPLAAAGAAAGLAAGLAASAPAEARSADKAPEPAIAPPAADESGDDKRLAGDDKAVASDDDKAFPGDDRPWEGDEKTFAPAQQDPDLVHAVEDMLAEVKAAEADLAAPTPVPGDGAADPMVSLERLLLGASAGDARAPAEPEPIAPALHRDAPDDRAEPEPVALEKAFETPRDLAPPREPVPAAPDLATIPDAEDFMARLRETISRPAAAPDLAPPPPAESEPEPARPEPAPLSIEEELERALQASLAEAALEAAPPPVVEPPRRSEPPRLELIRPDPAAAAAPGDDAMAALARDFPELNDLLAPKAPAVDPATSLMDDLKDIFEPQAKAAPRQEPVLAAPLPPMPPLLREGVIAGIAFRLYGDGSIEADLAEGTTRFASLKDFRAHVGG